jgi:hypothetical protein
MFMPNYGIDNLIQSHCGLVVYLAILTRFLVNAEMLPQIHKTFFPTFTIFTTSSAGPRVMVFMSLQYNSRGLTASSGNLNCPARLSASPRQLYLMV